MDLMREILRPKLFDFLNMEEYGEWLCSHSQDVPDPGEVWCFRIHAEGYFWIKVGDGVRKYSDLWPMYGR